MVALSKVLEDRSQLLGKDYKVLAGHKTVIACPRSGFNLDFKKEIVN